MTYGRDLRGGYEFDPNNYGVDSLWVILTPLAAPAKPKARKRCEREVCCCVSPKSRGKVGPVVSAQWPVIFWILGRSL